jgi:hypothetical protein
MNKEILSASELDSEQFRKIYKKMPRGHTYKVLNF